ncbi:hypothetical protein [Chitinophaga sp. RAB17]|uniref:hypothetical protein n=1 Tax=Chitinophaga sp. RAB17 TaxID=3233049 RepID=UPI003F90AB91
MKTSKKLLIGFTGVLVFLMLFAAILLRVNYSKAITNEEQYNHQSKPDPKQKSETLQPFSVLVLTNGQADLATTETHQQDTQNGQMTYTQGINNINISRGDTYTLNHHSNVTTRQSGDTLFIRMDQQNDIWLTCPSLKVINNSYCNVLIRDFTIPDLTIKSGPNAGTFLSNNHLKSLTYAGELANDFSLAGDNTLDSVKITMGKGGALRFEDIQYKAADIRVDSLRELNIYGKAISCIKQIN